MSLPSLLLLAALAWAGPEGAPAADAPPPTDIPGPASPEAPRTLEEVWATLPREEVLAEARTRREVGDYTGATHRLDWLDSGGPPEAALIFERGLLHELQEQSASALADYEALLAAFPEDPLAVEAGFRRAVVLLDLDRAKESLAAVKKMQKEGDWVGLAATTWELEQGMAELRLGRKKGLKRIDAALASLEDPRPLAWPVARARYARVRWMLEQASAIPLKGDAKAAKAVVARAGLLGGAEDQLTKIAVLGEPEYLLSALLLVGDAYMELHDALLAAPPPSKLDEEQVGLYRQAIEQKVAVLPGKAWRYYDLGVQESLRTEWQGGVTEQLRARRAAVEPGT